MGEKAYRLPDPEREPDSFLVILYKTLKKVKFDDRSWDSHFFARCRKRTQELLVAVGGNVQVAAKCMKDLSEQLEADFDGKWTLETIVNYSYEWKAKHLRISSRDCLDDLAKAYQGHQIEKVLLPPPVPQVIPIAEPIMSEQERREGAEFFHRTLETMKKQMPKMPKGDLDGNRKASAA